MTKPNVSPEAMAVAIASGANNQTVKSIVAGQVYDGRYAPALAWKTQAECEANQGTWMDFWKNGTFHCFKDIDAIESVTASRKAALEAEKRAAELEAKLNQVETLEAGQSPTPTPDMARPDAGLGPPNGDPYGPVGSPNDTLFGLPKKAVLIGGAALAAFLLLK